MSPKSPLRVNWCAACEVGADAGLCPECGEPMGPRHPGGMGLIREGEGSRQGY